MEAAKILVIDDSKLIHKMFEVMLQPHTLVHAYDGQEGLHRLAENADVSLILLDVNMPKMNGLEFLSEVKGNADLSEIPVVVISTEGKEEDTERAIEAGAVEYIKKPFQSENVLTVVHRLAVN